MRRIALVLGMALGAAARGEEQQQGVSVTRKPPTVRTKVFEPGSPPADLHLSGNEAALTRSSFQCSAGLSYVVIEKKSEGAGRASAVIRVDAVQVELTLDNTIYLPKGATRKLTAHEQAHRQIAESVYEGAGEVAKRLATPLVGRTYVATAETPEKAAERASHAVIQKLCDDYMAVVPVRSSNVNDAFDRITEHGRNKVAESEAVERAFKGK